MVQRKMTSADYDLIVVGGGPAGVRAALACREASPDKRVLIVDGEAEMGYYRTLLPMFMTGKLPEEKLFFWRPGEDPGIVARTGDPVSGLDRANRVLTLESGIAFGYRKLILAQGGRPIVPPVFQGMDWPQGVFAVRSLTVARRIKEWLTHHREVVILGGGLVGSKTSMFLSQAGIKVTLVEREKHILPTVLSADSAAPLQRHLENLGVEIRTEATIDAFEADDAGAIRAARVTDGTTLPCTTCLIGIGGVPAIDWLVGSDLVEDGKLVVTPDQRTGDPDIFAIGDVVTIRAEDGQVYQPWTWPQAVAQGRLAGLNAFRSSPKPVVRTTRVNAQNIAGIPIMILGGPGSAGSASVVSRPDADAGIWREFFMDGSRIVGGALIGDIAGAGPLHYTMANKKTVGDAAQDLLQRRTRAIVPGAWGRLAQRRTVTTYAVEGETR